MLLSGNAAKCAACLARKSRAAQARSFRQLFAPTRKAHAVFMQYGAVRSLSCAKIQRRTGAFFSVNARPHPESACSIHVMRRSTRLALRENPAPHRRVLFGDCSPPLPESACSVRAAPRSPSASPTMQSPHNSPPSPKSTAKKRFPFGEGGAGGRTLSFF